MNREKIESAFFNVLEDINEYLPGLTLVGGWMPYIYSNFLWKTPVRNPVTTVDIDFGVDQSITRDYSKTIFETLSSLDYKERHKFFERISSPGCLLVEQENGTDEYIHDLRQDIFDRFKRLKDVM